MDWKEEFQHGLIWQDLQHRQLVEQINLLIQSVTTGNNDEMSFRKAAHFVIQYCNGHFKIEEEYMKKHGYPLMDSHIDQHTLFIKDFNEILKTQTNTDKEKSTMLLHKLMKWFTEHILTTDKLFASFLIRHGIH